MTRQSSPGMERLGAVGQVSVRRGLARPSRHGMPLQGKSSWGLVWLGSHGVARCDKSRRGMPGVASQDTVRLGKFGLVAARQSGFGWVGLGTARRGVAVTAMRGDVGHGPSRQSGHRTASLGPAALVWARYGVAVRVRLVTSGRGQVGLVTAGADGLGAVWPGLAGRVLVRRGSPGTAGRLAPWLCGARLGGATQSWLGRNRRSPACCGMAAPVGALHGKSWKRFRPERANARAEVKKHISQQQ